MRPRLPFVPKPAVAPLSLMTVGLLDEPVRELFGLRWSAVHEAAFRTEARAFRAAIKTLPSRVRFFPQALEAERRAAASAAA